MRVFGTVTAGLCVLLVAECPCSALGAEGPQALKGKAPATGSYDDYQTSAIGRITLQDPAEYILSIRGITKVGDWVMNVKKIELVPEEGVPIVLEAIDAQDVTKGTTRIDRQKGIITKWSNPKRGARWSFELEDANTFEVRVTAAHPQGGSEYQIEIREKFTVPEKYQVPKISDFPPPVPERQKRLEEFQDWRFGIFVHWGIEAGFGGRNKGFPSDQRAELMAKFDERANKFDAALWAQTFQDAGARYVTIVPRHGQGFALYPSQLSAHAKRNYVGEIQRELAKRDIPMFLYVNLNGCGFGKLSDDNFKDWDKNGPIYHKNMTDYLTELCQMFHPAGIWFDTWPTNSGACIKAGKAPLEIHNFAEITRPMRAAEPVILVGNKQVIPPYIDWLESERIFGGHFGQKLYEPQGVPVEAAGTLPGSSWFAKRPTQEDFLTPEEIRKETVKYIKNLVICAGLGNNYLLDTGPLPDGELQRVEVAILKGMGEWLKRNGEAIYGTRRGPLADALWGYNVAKGGRIYLHVLDNWDVKPYTRKTGLPKNGKIEIKGIPWKPASAHLLNDGKPIPISANGGGSMILDLSQVDADPIDTIAVLER